MLFETLKENSSVIDIYYLLTLLSKNDDKLNKLHCKNMNLQ